jgi:hypothetical protein
MNEQGYRPIPTADQLIARRKELTAAVASTPSNEGIGPQGAWNRYAHGEQGDDVVTPIGARAVRGGAVMVDMPSGADTHALEHPGVDDQRRWDTFARMPGEVGANIEADRAKAGLGESLPGADLSQGAAPNNVVPLQPRPPQG